MAAFSSLTLKMRRRGVRSNSSANCSMSNYARRASGGCQAPRYAHSSKKPPEKRLQAGLPAPLIVDGGVQRLAAGVAADVERQRHGIAVGDGRWHYHVELVETNG